MKTPFRLFLALLALLLLPACRGTLEVAFDTTATPDPGQSATMQVLQTQVATMSAARRPLDLNASQEDIRAALRDSFKTWNSLFADAEVTNYMADGSPQVERVQVWVDRLTARFRVVSGPLGGTPRALQISDGVSQERVSLPDLQIKTQPLGMDARNPAWEPPHSSPDTITPHPLDLEIDHPLGEMLLPTALAQASGSFTAVNMEKVAGRPALVVEWSDNQTTLSRLWIDTRLGVVLRMQTFDKSRATQITADMQVSAIHYDAPMPDTLFAMQVSEQPQFALDASGVPQATPIPPSTAFQPGAGELYFVVDQSPQPLGLYRLPGNCITGSDPCPQPLAVEGYPNKDNTVEPLVWSPDGTRAVMVHQGLLYRFTPERGEWKALAQFPLIINPRWSRDGQQVAFVVQMDDNLQEVYVVDFDGANMRNLTNGRYAGPDMHLWVEGWLADGRLLYEVIDHTSARPFVQRPQESAPSPLESLQIEHGVLAIMPDGQNLVFSTQTKDATILQITGLSNSAPRKLGTFKDASVAQVLISPDGAWVAFLLTSGGPDTTISTVYAIRPDGSDLRQLYQSDAIQSLVFAGPGYLLAGGLQNGRSEVIPLEGGSAHTITAPGLRLDQRMLGLSWR